VIRDRGNVIAGVCLAAFGIYVCSVAVKLPYVSEVGPGSGFFPLWLGIGILMLAACLIFISAGLGSSNWKSETSWKGSDRALISWFAVMVATALLGTLGFGLTFVLLTMFLVVALDRRPPLLAAGVALALAAAFYLIFVAALDVSLPKAPWGF
jgi:putative tricarboxylic transport membrane protein